MGGGEVLELLDAGDPHAFVDAVPQPGEQPVQEPDDRIGHVRCDAVRSLACGAFDAVLGGSGGHRFPDRCGDLGAREDLSDEGTPVREIGT